MSRLSCALAAACLAVVAYANVFDAPFVWDDRVFVVKNPAVTEGTSAEKYFLDRDSASTDEMYNRGLYRPLRTLFFRGLHRLFGDDPFPFHVAMVLLHAAVTALGLILLCRLGVPLPGAFAAACWFAVHPIHTEAVSWISSAGDPLCALFMLLALLSTNLGLALGCAAAALLCKEAAVTLPLLIFLVAGWRRALPFAALVIIYLPLRFHVVGTLAHPDMASGLWERFVTSGWLAVRYLGMSLVPVEQNAFVGHLPRPWWGALVALVLVIWAISSLVRRVGERSRRAADGGPGGLCPTGEGRSPSSMELNNDALPVRRCLERLLLLFFAALFPVLWSPLWVDWAERFVYLPSLFLLGAVGLALHRRLPPRFFAIAAGVLVVAGGLATWRRDRVWRDELVLWQETARVSPENPTVLWNLGLTLEERGRFREAAEALARAEGTPKPPGALETQLAQCWLRAQNPSAALAVIERGLSLPAAPRARAQLLALRAQTRSALGQSGAEDDYRDAIALAPDEYRLYLGRALFRLAQNQPELARADLDRALSLAPPEAQEEIRRIDVSSRVRGEP